MKELVQILKNTRQHLMTGVSHMIPFVVAGGILLAVSVMLYGKGAVPDWRMGGKQLRRRFFRRANCRDYWRYRRPLSEEDPRT